MKRNLLMAILLMSFGLLFSKTVTFTYYQNAPEIKTLKNNQCLAIYPNSMQSSQIGNPSLPYIAVKLLLPVGEKAVAVSYKKENPVQIDGNYNLYPHQGVKAYSDNSKSVFRMNKVIYNSSEAFPNHANKNFTTQYMNGYSILLSSFTPIEFTPKENKIVYYSKVSVTVITEKDQKAGIAIQNLSSQNKIIKKIRKFVDNPNDINLYPKTRDRSNYDILLITSSDFADSFDDYIDLYALRGYKTHIATTEDIDASQSGVDLPEKIRNYIIQEYQNNGISCVTLAGDVEIVPYRGFYCQVQSGEDLYEDDGIPADLYYSALDGTWNDDNDNLWGEIGEDDLLPDISVGRISFSNTNDLDNILHKIESYQDSPVEGELQKPLMLGEHLYDDPLTWGADYLDLLLGHHDDNGYSSDGIPATDDIETLYDRDDGTWTVPQMLAKINEGHSFIHHVGHANYNYSMRMGMSDVRDNNFQQVNGEIHNYTLVYSHGCVAGGFDYDDCIAEKMVEIHNFALAYIGNSRYGWFNEGTTEGPSEHLHREFVSALYGDHIGSLGAAHMKSKYETAPWVTAPGQHEEGAIRWCFYDCNVLGDPAAFVWTREPMTIQAEYPQNVIVGTTSINVSLSSAGEYLNNLRCVILKNNEIVGMGIVNESGNAEVNLDNITQPGEASLIVSGYNCKPVTFPIVFTVGDGAYVYLENYSISSGDNDLIEYGETVYPSFTLKNSGNQTAENVIFYLSSNDDNVTMHNAQISIGNIPSGEEIQIPDSEIYFSIAEDIPDNYNFTVTSHILYDTDQETVSDLSLTAYAPNAILQNAAIQSSDGIWNPGESVDIAVTIKNTGGAYLNNIHSVLSTTNSYINITQQNYDCDSIPPNGEEVFTFSATAADDTPLSTVVDFALDLTADHNYSSQLSFTATIGLIIETFESGDFSAFDWQFGGDQNWEITSSNPYEGNYCAKSMNISDNQSSVIYLAYNVSSESEISFYKKVSSEATYDFLNFYIDGTLIERWSGEEDWSEFSCDVQPGNHIFKWEYKKDTYVSNGEDCAWIDNIVFPNMQQNASDNDNVAEIVTSLHSAYPNPFVMSNAKSSEIKIAYALSDNRASEINIYNIKGQLVKSIAIKGKGEHIATWNLKNKKGYKVGSGVYLYRLKTNKNVATKKLIILK